MSLKLFGNKVEARVGQLQPIRGRYIIRRTLARYTRLCAPFSARGIQKSSVIYK